MARGWRNKQKSGSTRLRLIFVVLRITTKIRGDKNKNQQRLKIVI
jgi:hypothetical protein